jgi:DNA-binding CsgD family transcriptional regulator
VYDPTMQELSLAISEAAAATTLEEIGELAFPALARALHADASFLAVSAADFVRSQAIAGAQRRELSSYLARFLTEDPLLAAAISVPHPVNLLHCHVDRRAFHRSRAYDEFHRVRDFEHHLLVRFHGDRLTAPGTLSMGFTRGRRSPAFGDAELRIAELALPALRGAARRIVRAAARAGVEPAAERVASERGLTGAETRVLAALGCGLSNREIARRHSVSIETVKTHAQRIFRKLGVSSRAEAMARLLGATSDRAPHAGGQRRGAAEE